MLRRIALPMLRQRLGDHPQPRGAIRRVGLGIEELLHDRQEIAGALPVAGLVGDVERFDIGGGHAFALHLVHQPGQRVRQIKERGARGHVGLSLEQAGDQLHQLQPALQRRDRFGDLGSPGRLDLGKHANSGQDAGRAGIKDRADAAAHALGVDDQLDPRQRLWRLALAPRQKPVDQRLGKIHPGGQAKDAGGGEALKHRPACPLRFQWHPGGRRRTSRPGRQGRTSAPPRASAARDPT